MLNKQATYKDALSQMVLTTMVFNSGVSNQSKAYIAEKILFYFLLLGLTYVAILAVFARTGIDTWIQFSLYIVPLIAMVYGHLIFKSRTFRKILQRDLNGASKVNENERAVTCCSFQELWRFLRNQSMRTCFYPLCLVFYQWSAYLSFFYVNGNSSFSGKNISPKLRFDKHTWIPIYCTFWTVGMYVTGFVGCCFIVVVEILKLDIKNFLCLFGNSPFIHDQGDDVVTGHASGDVTGRARTFHEGYIRQYDQDAENLESSTVKLPYRLLAVTIGFLTLGVIDLIPEPLFSNASTVYEDTGEYTRGENDDVSDSGITEASCRVVQASRRKIKPREASEHLTRLMTNIENNSSLFRPFLVLLTFFSIVNLVTHVVAMVSIQLSGFKALHWWTLVRTFFWFLLAVRLLWTAATITKSLSQLMPHIYYLRSVGELPGSNEEWQNFTQLANTYKLGYRAYGFPLTLSQVASVVAVINFSFLIVISLISNKQQ